jgi:hypothetical protein
MVPGDGSGRWFWAMVLGDGSWLWFLAMVPGDGVLAQAMIRARLVLVNLRYRLVAAGG